MTNAAAPASPKFSEIPDNRLYRGGDRSRASHRARSPIPTTIAGAAAVAQFEVSELPAAGVGGEAGEPVAINAGEPQLRARVGAFLADDHPHPFRPAAQVQQAGELGDPGARPHFAAGVIGRFPDPVWESKDRLGDVVGDGHADGVVQAAARAG